MPENKLTKDKKTGKNKWKRMSFKGNKVWAAIGPDGDFLIKNNKILIKYNLNQDYEYLIKRENLKPESDAVPGKKKKTKKQPRKQPDPAKKIRDKGAKPYAAQKSGSNPSESNPVDDTCGCKEDANISNQNTFSKKIRDHTTFNNRPDSENTIIIYTDGASSGNPGPAGIGAVLEFNGHKKEISEFIGTATNNIAELTAIEKALEKIKRRELPVRLFTDSTYCAGVLSKGWKPQKNLDLINRIKNLIHEFEDFKIIKVKGHAGIELNERADVLATSAIKQEKKISA